jgi:hypothetical protein
MKRFTDQVVGYVVIMIIFFAVKYWRITFLVFGAVAVVAAVVLGVKKIKENGEKKQDGKLVMRQPESNDGN